MKPPKRQPCNECPFRRNSLVGYFGNDTPRHFVAVAQHGETPLPCHKLVDYERADWRKQAERVNLCAGFASFLENHCKSPRNPKLSKLLENAERNSAVFRTGAEMIEHHCPENPTPIGFEEMLDLLDSEPVDSR